ncbi:MAG TPA: alpha-L-arabinofuranosidase C-terminal domain-containing protein [Gemmataceae bacterium]|nr:alpha-L-arabinofuranosidase C-terminal domain-containing protein [Gemmataceae bacterium]
MKWSSVLVASLVGGLFLRGAGVRADPPRAQPLRIAVEAGKTGEPISKYIYGQFIEHLGRCIYGGLWAEMLEDRKFYHDVGAGASPWKAVGGADRVAMDKTDPFVGSHTPRIAAPGGLAQGELALRKGRKYVGRVWLAGEAGAAPVKVSLAWGDGPGDRQTVTVETLSGRYTRTSLAFVAGADTEQGRLEIVAGGKGKVLVGTVSLMPADNVSGLRADTLALLKELGAPVYRWPGGNFVSGYDWKDGLGDPDRRPPRKNPAWKGIEPNDFGLDEFMTFCRLAGAEPYVTVNSGLGEVAGAVEELQYANGAADTPMGRLRDKNGHAEPYKVKWWAVGNEMYGKWQLGHMPLEKYVAKHNQFAEAMRKVDPAIKLIAVGDAGPWSEGMLKHCVGHMDLLSEHFYCQEKKDLAAHVRQVPDAIRAKADVHRRYRRQFDALQGKDIRIAMDEWNYWYGPHVFGELGTRYFLKDALGIAAGLHEYARQSDLVFMANYAQTVNVIGCVKTTKTAAAFETTGLVLKLYRQHFGTLPVGVTANAPLDVTAAWTADRKVLTVAIVNPTLEKREITLAVAGARLTGAGRRWQIARDDPLAHNDPGQAPKVAIEEEKVTEAGARLWVAPCSVTLYALGAQ